MPAHLMSVMKEATGCINTCAGFLSITRKPLSFSQTGGMIFSERILRSKD